MRSAVAVTVSDLHLSHQPPLVRVAEPDWYEVMKRHLKEIRDVANELDGVPILYAGDIFHRYNPPPQLIRFALEHLPQGYAVPGQHDLPHHVYDNLERTAYGCLVQAGLLHDLCPGNCWRIVHPVGHLLLHGFPYGSEFSPRIRTDKPVKGWHVAVAHKYVWKRGTGYEGAPRDGRASQIKRDCDEYDAAVFGDNHRGFQIGRNVVNNGTMMRRKADEIEMQPAYSILWDTGEGTLEVERVPFDCCRKDLFIDTSKIVALAERAFDMTDFVAELSKLGANALDFVEALVRFCDAEGISAEVRSAIMEAAGK